MRISLIFLGVFLLIPFVSSTLIFQEDFDNVYNLGDIIKVNFSVENDFPVSDFLEVYIDCDGEELIVHKNYYSLDKNTKKYFSFEFPAMIQGNCNIFAEFGEDFEKSEEFEISNEILIAYTINDKTFIPSERIIINGTAVKDNGEKFDGGILIAIPGIIEKNIEVSDGEFSLDFLLAENVSSGDYEVNLKISEKDILGEILNTAEKKDVIEVLPKPTFIEIIAEDSIKPPFNFSFKINLLDQDKKIIENDTLIVKIFDLNNEIVFEKEIRSGEEVNYFFESNSKKGRWSINSYYGSLFAAQPLYVQENRQLKLEIIEENIRIINVGNVPYEGVFQFTLENSSYQDEILINLSLGVGESFQPQFDVEGYYNVSTENNQFQNVHLTGAAVFFDLEPRNTGYFFAFLITLSFLIILFLFRKKIFGIFNKKKNSSTKEKKPFIVSERVVPNSPSDEGGQKKSYIIFLKFDKYFSEIENLAKKYNFSFNQVNDSLGYILFYSPPRKKPEKDMFNFSKDILKIANLAGNKISIVLNSDLFVNKASFLKEFASVSRKMLDFVEDKLLIQANIFHELGIYSPKKSTKIRINGREFEVYLI